MKGSIYLTPNLILNIILIILIIFNIAVILTGTTQLAVSTTVIGKDRQLVYFSEAVLNSECLAYKEDGIIIKGLFDKNKLDSNPQLCLKSDGDYYVKIQDRDRGYWEFGTRPSIYYDENSPYRLSYPTTVKYQDKIVPAIMEVIYIER